MAKDDYVPSRDGDKVTWATTLKTQIITHGPTVGLTAGEITAVGADCTSVIGAINTFELAKTIFQQAGAVKTTNVGAAVKNLRTVAQRIKKNGGYTNAIGEALGIVGDEQTVDIPNSKPELKTSKAPSGWQIDFNLKKFFDGVNIYKKRAAESSFAFIARDTSSPYIDTASVDSGTRYRAFYVLGDTEVGLQSDEVVVSV